MPIVVDIDVLMAKRKMAVGALAEQVGITPANLAVLKLTESFALYAFPLTEVRYERSLSEMAERKLLK